MSSNFYNAVKRVEDDPEKARGGHGIGIMPEPENAAQSDTGDNVTHSFIIRLISKRST
jgi:hypothetical protein